MVRLSLLLSLFYIPILFLIVISSLSGTLLLILLRVCPPKVVPCDLSRKLLLSKQWFVLILIVVALDHPHLVATVSLCLGVDSLGHSCFSLLCITFISKIPGHCMVVPIRVVLKLESKA